MEKLVILSMFAGVFGTGLGGVFGAFFSGKSDRILCGVLSFAGGVMLSIVGFDLIPEALAISSLSTVVCGLIVGIAIIMLLNRMVDHITAQSKEQLRIHSNLPEMLHQEGLIRHNSSLYRAGVIMLLAIALHNLPEGIAIGSGGAYDMSMGVGLSVLIALHNIPEGMAISAPLTAGGMDRIVAILLTALSGASTILGAVLGFWAGGISDMITAFCISFAGGAMLYVVFGEIIPQSVILNKDRSSAVTTLVGFLTGLLMTQI